MVIFVADRTLVDEFKELKIQVNEALQSKKTVHTTSYAEYHKYLISQELFIECPDLGKNLKEHDSLLPLDDVSSVTGGELKTLQKFWEKKITELNDALKDTNAELTFADSHNSIYLGGKKPDVSLIVKNTGKANLFNIVALGDIKSSGKIDSSSYGQLETYLRIALTEQSFRSHMYGFLTDNVILIVLLAQWRRDGCFECKRVIQEAWRGGKAANVLSYLALSRLVVLGYTLPQVDPTVQLTGFLGCGLSGKVFQGKIGDSDVVVKCHNEKSSCDREWNTLKVLQRNSVPNIPTVRGKWDKTLALTPLGTSFAPIGQKGPKLSPSHIKALIETIQRAHEISIVHRDVSQNNIFLVSNGDVLLNDWASACKLDEEVGYEGWLAGGSEAILSSLEESRPVRIRPCDDLHSLVRTFYCLFIDPSPPILPLNKDNIGKIRRFWKERNSTWKRLIELAEKVTRGKNETYTLLQNELCEVFDVFDLR